jgi:hypothetical protein
VKCCKHVDGVDSLFVADYGFIDSFSELSLLPLADISGSSLGYIDSDSSQDIVETMDEASLAQMQVKQSII